MLLPLGLPEQGQSDLAVSDDELDQCLEQALLVDSHAASKKVLIANKY